jgi:DNA/RNA-binding domain of Phe-tRNA-synthetase-like protein
MDDTTALLVARSGAVCGSDAARAVDGPWAAPGRLEDFLAWVDPEVFALRPDYRVTLVAVDGIAPDPDDQTSEAMLQAAEAAARGALRAGPVNQLPQVAAWRQAYRAFGVKPKSHRNSLESLLRRAESGLPRINRLTDLYNAISVLHQIPLGGEDLARHVGPLRVIRASGTERFDTVADGGSVIEHPAPGEVVRCDELGVTCRRWNWRQGRRTQFREDSTAALFILDAIDPMSDDALRVAVDDLVVHLIRLGPDVRVASRVIASSQSV